MSNMPLKEAIQQARDYLPPDTVNCVVYHAPCNDGSGAALSAWMARGDRATYIRRTYHKPFNDETLRGKNVVVLDASFSPEHLEKLRKIANKVMILDHHYSAMQQLATLPGCFFAMENSGAILAWYYFHGLDAKPPMFLQLIEDRDLWKWQWRDLSEPLYYALREKVPNSDFKGYIPYVSQHNLDALIAFGKTLVAKNQAWCAEAAKDAKLRYFKLPNDSRTYKIMCREVDNDRLVSELSEYLYTHNDIDFVMLWSKTNDGKYKVSFRAQKDDVNLGDISQILGGGGHKLAAGAVLTISPLELTVAP